MKTKIIELIETQTLPDGNQCGHSINLKTNWHCTEDRNISVAKLLSEEIIPICIEIMHQEITTQLDFTGVTPYEIWYFDSDKNFTGKTFSLHEGTGTFRVETQARFILIWNTKEDENTKIKLQSFDCKSLVF